MKLCLSSKKEGNINLEWYCDSAISAYERSSVHWPPVRRQEVMQRKAIEAMLVDAEYYLSLKKSNMESAKRSKSRDVILLEVLLNSKAVLALMATLFFITIYMYYRFYSFMKDEKNSHGNSSNINSANSK